MQRGVAARGQPRRRRRRAEGGQPLRPGPGRHGGGAEARAQGAAGQALPAAAAGPQLVPRGRRLARAQVPRRHRAAGVYCSTAIPSVLCGISVNRCLIIEKVTTCVTILSFCDQVTHIYFNIHYDSNREHT